MPRFARQPHESLVATGTCHNKTASDHCHSLHSKKREQTAGRGSRSCCCRGSISFRGSDRRALRFTFNKKIPLTRDAQLLAQRNNCYCDLYWESGLDVECQSSLVHQNEGSFLSDSDRTAALRRMGIDVLPITYGQLADASRFDALSRTISSMLDKPHPTKSDRQKQLSAKLRQEVLADWGSLHKV